MSAPMQLDAPRPTSVFSIIALILAILTIPGMFCCTGVLTGPLSVVFAIIGIVQARNGTANDTSKLLSFISIGISGLFVVGYLALFGFSAVMSSIEKFNGDPAQVTEPAPTPVPPG